MEIVSMPISPEQLRSVLGLPATADVVSSFDDLGIDSWGLIELRASLEARFGVVVSDDEWIEITCPADVLRLTSRTA